jgi:hypothetical protein
MGPSTWTAPTHGAWSPRSCPAGIAALVWYVDDGRSVRGTASSWSGGAWDR